MYLTYYPLIVFIAYGIFWLYQKFYRLIYLGSKFDGPTAYPIIGTAYLFYNKTSTGKSIKYFS